MLFDIAIQFFVLFQALAANVDIPASKFVPTVAFKCGKPAMHKTASGWKKDLNADCKDSKLEILKYCQNVSINIQQSVIQLAFVIDD